MLFKHAYPGRDAVRVSAAPKAVGNGKATVEHAAPCDATGACLACGGTLRQLGQDVTELLDYVPGSFRIIRRDQPSKR